MEFEQYMSSGSERKEDLMDFRVQRISDGLGFGEGTISYADRAGSEVSPKILARVETLIESPEILVPVQASDDGCGDGREVGIVYEGSEVRNRSLNRAKIFGGGATMAAASSIGLGHARGQNLHETFDTAAALLVDRGLDYGAHRDNHAHGENSGCGAIDKAPINIGNVVKYRQPITETIKALGVDTSGLDNVIEAFGQYEKETANQTYSGAKVVEDIQRRGRVVKELKDNHNEMFVILNDVAGKTVNQGKVREVSNGAVQVFAVDTWHLSALAEAMYPESKGFSDSDRHEALLSELVYTLATAATLTKGDLPIIMISPERELART